MIGRLDIKMVLILLVTVLLPLGVSVLLVMKVVDSSLGLGLNEEVAAQLEKTLEMHRTHIKGLRSAIEHRFARLADSETLHRAALDGGEAEVKAALSSFIREDPALEQICLFNDEGRALEVSAPKRSSQSNMRLFRREAQIEIGPYRRMEAAYSVDASLQESYEKAGKTYGAYKALVEAPSNYLKNRFVWVYLAVLGAAVIVCVVGGIYLARRLVRRIHKLSNATTMVAEGDLSVRVDPGGDDEVGQLVESFNRMVAELSVNRARIEYLQKISAWQEMARRLAHEIKNPLTPIQLAAQQLREKYGGEDPAFQGLLDQSTEIISEEVATLRRLTSDFAAFAKLPEVRPENVNLKSFLDECEASLAPVSEDAGVRLSFDNRSGDVKVRIDRVMMKRVIDNLVRNAVEAIREVGTRSPEVTVTAIRRRVRRKLEVEIRIQDNGPGVMPEHHPSIFDPYFTTKSEGTGLGLAISKKIVLEHGGRIWLDEEVAEGAAFVVVLPTLS